MVSPDGLSSWLAISVYRSVWSFRWWTVLIWYDKVVDLGLVNEITQRSKR